MPEKKPSITVDRPIERLAKIVLEQTECHAGSGTVIDTHFIEVGITEAAADHRAFDLALTEALDGHGWYGDIDAQRLAQGPSYIEFGGWIGDQSLALRFMALAEFHGYGKVITPKTLGVIGEEADRLAGSGMVLLAPTANDLSTEVNDA